MPNPALDDIAARAANAHLMVMGALHEQGETIVLLGPREPGFWAYVSAQPEFADGAPDPLDRWSKRMIVPLAAELEGTAVFPSDGPPYPPFISWALASGRSWVSPAGLLVHDVAGLFASYRGALRVPALLELPPATVSPCETCTDQPCASACPVDALQHTAYDVPACRTHVLGSEGSACRTTGCAARRACPVSQTYGRLPDQSAFHMRAFLGE